MTDLRATLSRMGEPRDSQDFLLTNPEAIPEFLLFDGEPVYRARPQREVLCDYCKNVAPLVTGREVYPHRPDLFGKRFYLCAPCKAYVGCHDGTTNALGRLANGELRSAKMKAHAAFDPLWKGGEMKRKDAYYALSQKLQIHVRDCHIGMFDVDTCARVPALCKEIAHDRAK